MTALLQQRAVLPCPIRHRARNDLEAGFRIKPVVLQPDTRQLRAGCLRPGPLAAGPP